MGEVAKWVKHIFRTWMAKRGADYVEKWSGARIEQQENITQAGDGVTAPRTPGLGVALVRVPEELDSLCVEHSREAVEYYPSEDFEEGERDVKTQDKVFANRAGVRAQQGEEGSTRGETRSRSPIEPRGGTVDAAAPS